MCDDNTQRAAQGDSGSGDAGSSSGGSTGNTTEGEFRDVNDDKDKK